MSRAPWNNVILSVRWERTLSVAKRSHVRWTAQNAAAEEAGYRDIYRKSLITLTEMQKLMGKQKFDEILGGLIYKPPGKPTLVPMNIPDQKHRHSGRVETTVPADWKLSIRALETGLKPLKYKIVSRHHVVKPLSRKGCVSRLYCMMKRCNAVRAVSFSPESWFPVLRTQGVNGAGIFIPRTDRRPAMNTANAINEFNEIGQWCQVPMWSTFCQLSITNAE